MDVTRREEILAAYEMRSTLFDEIARRRRARLAPPDLSPPPLSSVPIRTRRLSGRAAQVLDLIAEGYGNKEIATRLLITPETAKTHVRNVIASLGARNRAHAVAIGYRQGLLGNRNESVA